jgi:cytidylate kinase
MQQPLVIAIDGPAGAGKSTLGALLAKRLGYLYFDTGVMYRALTLAALQSGIDLAVPEAVEDLAKRIVIEVAPPAEADGRQYTVLADGADVTWAIRSPEVERGVSLAARYPGVRREMVRQQQAIGGRGRVVMVGRDIGTVVMPDAALKIYLEASLDERARRRTHERAQQHDPRPLDEVRSDMARRDSLDQHVLRPADDAVVLRNDGLSPDAEVDWIIDYIGRIGMGASEAFPQPRRSPR